MAVHPALKLHVLPHSHPSKAAEKALEIKGLEFERVELAPGEHTAVIEEAYGEGRTTVPGLLVGDQPVHGSRAIMARLEELEPDPSLYPDPIAERVREAERWGDEELQDLGRRLPFGALHFRPEYFGTLGGAPPLDPAGTDFAIKYIRAGWKYHGMNAQMLAADLERLPSLLAQIEEFAEEGLIDGEQPTAADLQIGSTCRIFLMIGDLKELMAGTAGKRIAERWFADYPGECPAGAFPAGWVPQSLTTS